MQEDRLAQRGKKADEYNEFLGKKRLIGIFYESFRSLG